MGNHRRRRAEERFFKALMIIATGIVMGSLLLIVGTIVVKGFPALNLDMITKTPKGGYYLGKEGGILNAILGSLYLAGGATLLAFLLSLPLALFLDMETRSKSGAALRVRFALDVLWGIPSIVYGAFGFLIMALVGLRASLLAGIIIVALLELPIMARSMDEVVRLVPAALKDASASLGATRLETAVRVVLRQCLPGLLTAVLIAFGRGVGDAASVLFTAGFTDSLPTSLFQPAATLPLAIFFQLGTPFPEVRARAYASAAVLTLIILIVSLAARWLSRKLKKHTIQ
ncbi:MAG: ABC transporter permease subunit [Candidatus Aminicenantes bacterium]|nr:ABC transporter permease subunit [Candidatus Aminicenantes bacterium]